jgi:hypothetical protein
MTDRTFEIPGKSVHWGTTRVEPEGVKMEGMAFFWEVGEH